MNSSNAIAQGTGIDLERARQLFDTVTHTEYANSTVFVEKPSLDPMAVRLQHVLREAASQKGSGAPLPEASKE